MGCGSILSRCSEHKRVDMPMKERLLALLLHDWAKYNRMAIYDRQKCAIIRKISAKIEILLKIRLVVPEF